MDDEIHGQVNVIEHYAGRKSRALKVVDWLCMPFVKDIDAWHPRRGSLKAKVFCYYPDLLNQLLFMDREGDFLVHNKYQMVDAKVHICIYYTDGSQFFDQRYVYFFHDGTVDKYRVNNIAQ